MINYLYKLTNKGNGKVYFGVTKDLHRRISFWVSAVNNPETQPYSIRVILNDIRKYATVEGGWGVAMGFEVIDTGGIEDISLKFIDIVRDAKKTGNCYNQDYCKGTVHAKVSGNKTSIEKSKKRMELNAEIEKAKKLKQAELARLRNLPPPLSEREKDKKYYVKGVGFCKEDNAYYVRLEWYDVIREKLHKFLLTNIKDKEVAIQVKIQTETDFGRRSA